MGIDTYGKIKGYVSPEQIVHVIKDRFNVETVTSNITTYSYDKFANLDFTSNTCIDGEYWKEGRIEFEISGEKRNLFYYYSSINDYENLSYYEERFPDRPYLKEMVKSESTNIILGYWGSSVEIVETIVSAFGGWIDDNDCDDIPYREVEKN